MKKTPVIFFLVVAVLFQAGLPVLSLAELPEPCCCSGLMATGANMDCPCCTPQNARPDCPCTVEKGEASNARHPLAVAVLRVPHPDFDLVLFAAPAACVVLRDPLTTPFPVQSTRGCPIPLLLQKSVLLL